MEGIRELAIYIGRRVLTSILVIFAAVIIVFLISHVLTSNPAALWAGPKAKPSTINYIIERYHLKDPLYIQFEYFTLNLLTGNLGLDPVTGKPIASEILFYFPNTLELVLSALLIIIIVGVGLGYIAAIKFGSKIDAAIRIFYTAAWASPIYLISVFFILAFSSWIPLFPSGGMYSSTIIPPRTITGIFVLDSLLNLDFSAFLDGLYHLVLPSVSLAFLNFGIITRISRNGILSVKWLPHVKLAKAKGLDEKYVNRYHILRNGLIESNTMIAVMFGWLITGTVVTEEIFSWPGVGRFAYEAITSDNYPVLIYIVILFTVFVIVANLIADILYAILDPRIRMGGE
ncbi:MAG: ABC transporter permease [Thermoplasmata archaeon]|jgi:peptide/nickel transport system permease protein|nr:ABC transporter permease [Thermoplasmata archaeon]MVT13170.1 ABC transporter permease subunit [Euryarchaeota archaeon]MVT14299.1 ABC transporter permease subunit [Euryarchaeota archaeon]MVT36369.1 ABC transporter permease subunit [Euryarchaeota archaeon]